MSIVSPERRNKMLRALSDEQIAQARIWYHKDHKPIKWIARHCPSTITGKPVSQYTIWRWVVNISEAEVLAIKATADSTLVA